jgi:transcriptional regulator with XRE-family HTH domain
MKIDKDQGDSLLLRLGRQLQAVRKDRNLTQRDVYQQTGIHAARIERGKVNLSFTTLLTLCQALGVKAWEVLKALDV